MNSRQQIRGAALLAALWLAGCQQILGVDELKGGVAQRDGDGGVDGGTDVPATENPSKADCDEYCGAIEETCAADTKASFRQKSYCEGLCPHMVRTEDHSSENANTFDCRLRMVNSAAVLGGDNLGECRAAGAGGDGRCGSDCEGYCQLFEAVCGKFPGLSRGETCVSECENLAIDRSRDAIAAFDSMSDTLQCRLSHLGAASTSDEAAVPHCKHAAISLTSEYTPCVIDTPRCEDFCTLTMNACKGNMQQYETFQDCVAICKNGLTLKTALGPDEPIDISHDTVACRRYHVYNAIKAPDGVHCEHGGPTGDGHCGKICPSYCQMAKAACATQYATKYMNNDAACESECNQELEAEGVMDQLDHHYSVPKGKASDAAPMQCRVYRLSKAFLAPGMHCDAALGSADCQ